MVTDDNHLQKLLEGSLFAAKTKHEFHKHVSFFAIPRKYDPNVMYEGDYSWVDTEQEDDPASGS